MALKAAGWLTTWFVREPLGRIHSVYRYFAAREQRFRERGIVYAMSWPMRVAYDRGRLFESFETFVERALNDFPHDKHIAPQTGWGAEQCEIIAPLERSAEVALPITLPRINATCGECAAETPQAVRSFYANDITYWKRVCDTFHPAEELHDPDSWPNVGSEIRRQEELVRTHEV